jgi:hypothetical protein
MQSTINQNRYVPSYMNGHFDGYGEVFSNCEVFFTTVPDSRGKWCAIAYIGKRLTNVWHHYWNTKAEMESYIEKFIKSCKETVEYKANIKAEKKKQNDSAICKVGEIYVNSWGYDQTNVDYYQVIAVKGKTATLQEINSEAVEGTDGFMSCRVRPVPNSFHGIPFTKRIQGYNGQAYFSFSYGGCSLVTEGQTNYCSWYA